MDLDLLKDQMNRVTSELIQSANLKKGDAIILGGSTSEIIGEDLGSATNMNVAETLVNVFYQIAKANQLFPIVQSCEHINRALVVEEDYAAKYNLMPINVLPIAEAGGGFSTAAMDLFKKAVVVERVERVAAGIDIGDVFIGMHLDPDRIGVVVRSETKKIGYANLSMIRTRAKLIGGDRSKHF